MIVETVTCVDDGVEASLNSVAASVYTLFAARSWQGEGGSIMDPLIHDEEK